MIDFNFWKLNKNDDAKLLEFIKKQYSENARRIMKAQEYFEKETTTREDIRKHEKTFLDLMHDNYRLGSEYERLMGEELTPEIIVNGFEGY